MLPNQKKPNPIVGIDKRPIVEIDTEEPSRSRRWVKMLEFMALSSIAIVGVKWAGSNFTISMDPDKLTYLTKGLNKPGGSTWTSVLGLAKDAEGLADVPLKAVFLEGVKRAEEAGGSIGRTIGLFQSLAPSIMTSEKSVLDITPQMLEEGASHYEALLGRKPTHFEKLHGFRTGEVTVDHIVDMLDRENRAKGIFLGSSALRDQAEGLMLDGTYRPGELPGLFSVNEKGVADQLVRPDVKIAPRLWNVDNPDTGTNPKTGRPSHQQRMRMTDRRSQNMGASPVSAESDAAWAVYKSTDEIKPSRATVDVLEAFGVDTAAVTEKANNVLGQTGREFVEEMGLHGQTMSERFFRMLDNPAEIFADMKGGSREPGSNQFLRNIFGTGGDYSGSMLDMWGRHAGRIVPLALGAAAVYEIGSRITKAVTGQSVAQIGGQAIGATQRTYAGVSDFLGLTSLNKTQEQNAEGSHRLAGVLAFPFAGYLAGRVAASSVNPVVTEGTKLAWETAREEIHQLPEFLQLTKSEVPIVGDLSKGMTRGKKFGVMGAAIGGVLAAPFLLGALGSNKSYEEVSSEQSGESEVAIKKARFWEMGRTDWDGEQTQYYRPGWFRRLMDDPGEELQDGGYSDEPITRGLKSLIDPYWKEKKLFYDRPYPETGPDVSSFGPLGSIWGMTLGRVLKPPKMMHADEITAVGSSGTSGGDVIQYTKDASKAPDSSLGGRSPAPAGLQSDQSFLARDLAFKFQEASGLPGFLASSILKKTGGAEAFGSDQQVLASFSDIGGFRDKFWDLGLGGGATTTESVRRFASKKRAGIIEVNPIANNMPDWLPGPGNYTDFQHGDPYAAIDEGEYRLPGSGYEKRFTELSGIDPTEYPDIHKYKILADVAPFSKELESISKKIDTQAQSGQMSERDYEIYQGTKAQLEERRHKVHFRDEPTGVAGKYWAGLTSLGRMSPVEHLLPVSPIHKFSGPVDAISEYEDRNVYSTRSPNWETPVDDFIKPAASAAARLMGWEGIPTDTQEKRDLVGYFDKLQYTKFKRLEANARDQGEGKAAFAYARKAQYTMFGADPYANLETVEKVLPSEERPFFEEFLSAKTPEEKGRILELVPEYTKKFYTAQWQKQLYASLAAKGDLSSDELQAAKQIESARAVEGEATDGGTWSEYKAKVRMGSVRKNTFPDYIRAKRLQNYFEEDAPYGAPGADWIGYAPGVDMDMVKLKVVQNEGRDFHDFSLWENDVQDSQRMPYLDPAATQLMSSSGTRENLVKSLTSMRIDDLSVDVTPTYGGKNRVSIDMSADRRGDIDSQLRKAGVTR